MRILQLYNLLFVTFIYHSLPIILSNTPPTHTDSLQTLCPPCFSVHYPISTAQMHTGDKSSVLTPFESKTQETSQESGLNKCKTRNKRTVWNSVAHINSQKTVICTVSSVLDSLTNAIKQEKPKWCMNWRTEQHNHFLMDMAVCEKQECSLKLAKSI